MNNVINLPKLVKAKFSYFDLKGAFYTSADGHMEHDWYKHPNSPRSRRDQIVQSNKGVMPGMRGRASAHYIYIVAGGSPPALVFPENTVHSGGRE